MKRAFGWIMVAVMLLALASCGKATENSVAPNEPNEPLETGASESEDEENAMINISVIFNGSAFSAKFYDNETTRALTAQFPMTLRMADLHRNEKYYNFADKLPSRSDESPATMNAGDIMLWQGNCLVLFYETFSNAYGGYDRLGYVEVTSDLAAALGSGGVEVTFAVNESINTH